MSKDFKILKGAAINEINNFKMLTLVLLNPDIHCLCKQCRFRSVALESGSALFAIQYVNLYQRSGSLT